MLLQNGLLNAKALIMELSSTFKDIGDHLNTANRTNVDQAQEKYADSYVALDKMDEDLRAAQKVLTKKKWTKEFNDRKQNCLTNLAQYIEASLTQAAVDKAIDIYHKLQTFLTQKSNELDAVEQGINEASNAIKEETKRLLEPQSAAKGTFELNREVLGDPKYLKSFYDEKQSGLKPKTLWQDYSKNLNYEKLDHLEEWCKSILKKDLIQHAKNQFDNFISDTSLLAAVDEYYGEKAPEKIKVMLEDLLKYCVPFLQYDTDVTRALKEGKSIIGVEDKENHLIPKAYKTSTSFNLVSTGFKHRIDVVRYKHGIPAFLINGMNEYKGFYEQVLEHSNDPLHIIPNAGLFEDIFPDEHKECRHIFALSLVFDLIVQIGYYYYLDLKREYTGELKIKPARSNRLANGRTNAEENLIHNPTICEALSEELDTLFENMGNKAVIELVKGAIVELKIHKSKLAADQGEMISQLQHEIEHLEDKIIQLGGTLD